MPSEKYYKTLLLIAEEEIIAAERLSGFHKPQIEIVCYLCHQCVEKSLKAFLDYHEVNFKHIRDLVEINLDCQTIDISFNRFDVACYMLSEYYFKTRYSRNLVLIEKDMTDAIDYAKKVLNFVKEMIIEG